MFEFYETNPDAARVAFEGLASVGRAQDAAVVDAYDFGGAAMVVDVGGGAGALLRTVLASVPEARGVLLDRPHVIAMARRHFTQAGLGARVDLVGGDFFEAIPPDGGLYILRKVIHDWDDARARTILRHCRGAMRAESRLLLIEAVVPEDSGYSYSKLLDLLKLVYAGGQERTFAEYRALLASADLQISRVISTACAVSIIEAVPIATV